MLVYPIPFFVSEMVLIKPLPFSHKEISRSPGSVCLRKETMAKIALIYRILLNFFFFFLDNIQHSQLLKYHHID